MAIDYRDLLAHDVALGPALNAIRAQSGVNLADLLGSSRRALASFGNLPSSSLLGSVLGTNVANQVVDQNTRDLANAATQSGISTWAQLQHAANVNHANDLAHLAARGMIRSGALGSHLAQEQLSNNQAQYNATQNLLDQLQGFQQNYLGAQQTNQQNAAQATSDALNRIIGQINSGQISGSGAGAGSGAAGRSAAPFLRNHASDHPMIQPYRQPSVGYTGTGWSYPRTTVPRTIGYNGSGWSYPSTKAALY